MNIRPVLIFNFGGQYIQLIARRVREANVYCEIVPFDISFKKIKEKNPQAIILSGSQSSVYDKEAPYCTDEIFEMGIPVFGICYGSQLMMHHFGGNVTKADDREYGRTEIEVLSNKDLFKNVEAKTLTWMSHGDYVEKMPSCFTVLAKTGSFQFAAVKHNEKPLFAVQFHPEVHHTERGTNIIRNFLFEIAGIEPNWFISDYANQMIKAIKEEIGDKKAILGLSGGVDSSVAAVLMHKAIEDNLTCVFVDHGLLRKNEGDQVEAMFKGHYKMNFIRVNAGERFLTKLKGVSDPEKKRKIIGEEFIRVFEEEKNKLCDVNYLVQGTIYPDIIESGTGKAAVIKSHHNVGGLPKDVDFKIVEPLRELFKDEVRKLGYELGMAAELVERQPFPGPGLAIRVLGEITKEKLKIVREADWIFREEIRLAGLEREIWQYFACLPNIRSVGVMGDERTYDHTIALRAVTSVDGMTSDWAHIPFDVLARISQKIVNKVKHVNRVVYDITSKPPSTIEWE